MKKKYLLNGVVALALGFGATGCTSDDDFLSATDALEHASKQLNLSIPSSQDWKMISSAEANITVNGDYGETYTVKIYSNDPLVDGKGYVLAKGTIENGNTFTSSFQYPSALNRLVVGIADSKGYTYYKTFSVVNGKLDATIGSSASTNARRHSMESPEVLDIEIPDDDYAKSFLEGAKEPTAENTVDNYDNTTYAINYGAGGPNYIDWGDPVQTAEREYFFSLSWEEQIAYALANHPSWLNYTKDETFVTKFKITGEYNGGINVLSTEEDPAQNTKARTVYISGKWTVSGPYNSTEQRVGGGAVIVVDEGGELNIPEGILMNFVNEARLVVMPGGKITGDGEIQVTNGNAEGLEGYNGGTIEIGTFNNNFGKFYNYGDFKCEFLEGGAGLSNFYNHGVAHIGESGVANDDGGNYLTANTRIYNACQFVCDRDMRAYQIEMTQGSYFNVGGELMMSGGEDGTADNSYVALANGALMQLGSLYNNGTSWVGPTEGYAVVEIGTVKFLNWEDDGPLTGGYFINNIALTVDEKDNACKGKSNEKAYDVLRNYVVDGKGTNGSNSIVGNGGIAIVEEGKANLRVEGDEDFELGVSGCTPGYEGEVTDIPEENETWTYAFEDTYGGDYDMNDVVFRVKENEEDPDMLDVTLCACGAQASINLYLATDDGEDIALFGGVEVHAALGGTAGRYINTGNAADHNGETTSEFTTYQIPKPENFSFETADFYIEATSCPEPIHIAHEGEDPHGMVIPGLWEWPTEWTPVSVAYTGFGGWAEGDTFDDWYNSNEGANTFNDGRQLRVTESLLDSLR